MKAFLTLFFFVLISMSVFGQREYLPCGTPPGKTAWLKKFQSQPEIFRTGSDTLLYVPLTIHITGSTTGFGYISPEFILSSLCQLNQDFAMTNLRFFIQGDWNYIDSSEWHDHQTIFEGTDMMNANNVANTVNSYFVNTAAGNAGYNLPHADGVVVRILSTGLNDHTWSHEIGHNLSVQHTFLGWEGGVSYDGSVSHNYNDPAPLTVLYDYTNFQDTLILDTLIVDTAYVEFVDGSNCSLAADGFCDTPADYLGFRWPCNANGMSNQFQRDPNGVLFQSDGSSFMSYSFDECQSVFTEEQTAAMRANLYDEKPGHLQFPDPEDELITDDAEQLYPVGGELVDFQNVELQWESVQGATQYLLELNRVPTFNALFTVEKVITADTFYMVQQDLINGSSYYWRIRPFSETYACTSYNSGESFQAGSTTSIEGALPLHYLEVFPNPLMNGSSLQMLWSADKGFEAESRILDLNGRTLWADKLNFAAGIGSLELDLPNLPAGVFFLQIIGEGVNELKKLVVTN